MISSLVLFGKLEWVVSDPTEFEKVWVAMCLYNGIAAVV